MMSTLGAWRGAVVVSTETPLGAAGKEELPGKREWSDKELRKAGGA
jgi:hypothetical protein